MAGDNKKMDPAVLAAIITVAGGIIITLITTFANRPAPQPQPPTLTPYPTWTDTAVATITFTPKPTDTVPAGEPSSTPAPDTPSPPPTATLPPPALGEDWANDCISSLWQPVPASIETQQQNGCLQQPIGDFSVSKGRLVFLVNRRFNGVQINGMFAPLPSKEGEVSLKVDLDVLDKGEIWMGVFAQPSTDSQGIAWYIPPGDIQKRLLVMLTLPGNTKNQTKQYNPSNAVYDVKFKYNVSSVTASAMSDSTIFNAVGIPSAQKWLFVGYRSANGINNIGAAFFELAFK
jgi:hypothetical protein